MSQPFRYVRPDASNPHDVLKVSHWSEHGDSSLLPAFLKDTPLAGDVSEHHNKRWMSDMLASALARPFFDGVDFVVGGLDTGMLFFIPVYEADVCVDGAVVWSREDRRRLQEEVWRVYEDELKKGGDWLQRANERVNEMLSYFPADTWAPVASLKSHHITTYLLHGQGEEVLSSVVKGRERSTLVIFLISIEDKAFHRLRELRDFYRLKEATVEKLTLIAYGTLMSDYGLTLPLLRVGDDLLTVTVDRNVKNTPVDKAFLRSILKSDVQCLVRVVKIPLVHVSSSKRGRPYWVVESKPTTDVYTIGTRLEEGVEGGRAEFAQYLEHYPLTAWVFVKPMGGLAELCERFVEDYAFEVMRRLCRRYGFDESALVRAGFHTSPDLMITAVDDYSKFLRELQTPPVRMTPVIVSFTRSIFIWGLRRYGQAIPLYERVVKLRGRLHIPVGVTVIATYSKLPFWRVVELSDKYLNTLTIYTRGGECLSLKEEDFKLMREMPRVVSGIKSTVWNREVVPAVARSLSELEFELDRLSKGSKRKITPQQAHEILEFARAIDKNHAGESEEVRRKIRLTAFKRLADFAGA